ncbi:hypothetical protein E1287_34725 [Actinomadura sp. KC06]|uniref:hypothetical protein n=1 Tax=Actinomadura sp. KC06 TaxID=2530369 RepID=UPI001053AB82|nr:hypothetical protein [Actinomadura sp. KC06]TDD27373.1 hypothetical protein E1287_34725 [Actinomadura sp. KC06]
MGVNGERRLDDRDRRDDGPDEKLLQVLYYSTWLTPTWLMPMWRTHTGARPWFGPWLKRRLGGCRVLGRRSRGGHP